MAPRRRFTRLSVESLETRRLLAYVPMDLPAEDPGPVSLPPEALAQAHEQEAQALQDAPAGLQGNISGTVWSAFKEIESLVLDHFIYHHGAGLPLSQAHVPSAPLASLNDDGEVLLDIALDEFSDAALARLEAAGFRVEGVIPEYRIVTGWMGGLNLRALEAVSDIGQIQFTLSALLRESEPLAEPPSAEPATPPAEETSPASDLVAAPAAAVIELDPEIHERAQANASEHLAAAGAEFKHKTSRAFREGIAAIGALIFYGDDPAASGPLPIARMELPQAPLAQVTDSGRVLLEIDLADLSANTLAKLEEAGLNIAAQFGETQRVLGWIDALDVTALAAISEVTQIKFEPSFELDPRLPAPLFVPAEWLQPWWQEVLEDAIVFIGPQLPPTSGAGAPAIVIGGVADDDGEA